MTHHGFMDSFKKDVTGIIANAVANAVSVKFDLITKQIADFSSSLSFLSEQYETYKKRQEEDFNILMNLQDENAKLKSTVTDLSLRLNLAEQYQRENNVEIHGIPEHRTENLTNCINHLAKTVGAAIIEEDIMQVARVSKLDKDSKRPRIIIAKLRNSRQRDVLLAAVHNFNKKNPEKKLASHHLGLAGENTPVYVSEHLTPTNKYIHAAARKKAKDMKYKFVWVRNGRVFVRKNESSPAILIRNLDSVNLIT
ncbi:hypothetical protein ACJJTC_001181 [Scirpophaga incertulas]